MLEFTTTATIELVVLLVYLLLCGSLRSVSLPRNADGWSVIVTFLGYKVILTCFLLIYTCCVYMQTFPKALFVKATV